MSISKNLEILVIFYMQLEIIMNCIEQSPTIWSNSSDILAFFRVDTSEIDEYIYECLAIFERKTSQQFPNFPGKKFYDSYEIFGKEITTRGRALLLWWFRGRHEVINKVIFCAHYATVLWELTSSADVVALRHEWPRRDTEGAWQIHDKWTWFDVRQSGRKKHDDF